MKKYTIAALGLVTALAMTTAFAWEPDEVMMAKADEAKSEMLEKNPEMQHYFDEAFGWAIIPTVGKGAIGVGGAHGKGLLYVAGVPVANVTMNQITVGFQLGGQAYAEFIFFEDDVAVKEFKRSNYELGAQASAVALTAGASADADYSEGVAIFTYAKGGLMYEASVGGQKFKVEKD